MRIQRFLLTGERVLVTVLAVVAGIWALSLAFGVLARLLIPHYGNQEISTAQWVTVFGSGVVLLATLSVGLFRRSRLLLSVVLAVHCLIILTGHTPWWTFKIPAVLLCLLLPAIFLRLRRFYAAG